MNNTIDDEPTRLIGHIYTVYEACHILQHHWVRSWVVVTKHTAGQKLLNTSVVLLLCNILSGHAYLHRGTEVLEWNFSEWWIISCFIANLDSCYKGTSSSTKRFHLFRLSAQSFANKIVCRRVRQKSRLSMHK